MQIYSKKYKDDQLEEIQHLSAYLCFLSGHVCVRSKELPTCPTVSGGLTGMLSVLSFYPGILFGSLGTDIVCLMRLRDDEDLIESVWLSVSIAFPFLC